MKFSEEPFIEYGTVLVPMRELYEALGLDVSWDNTAKRAIAVKEDTAIEFVAGQNTAILDGQEVNLTAAARIINNTIFVPLKFICESIGAAYTWDNQDKAAVITAELNKDLKVVSIVAVPEIASVGEEIIVTAKVQGNPARVELSIPSKNINMEMYKLAGWEWGTYGLYISELGHVPVQD